MSRNYPGLLPLRGLEPPRTEARAWLDIVHWRTRRRIPISHDEAMRADRAITTDPDCIVELKASPTERTR